MRTCLEPLCLLLLCLAMTSNGSAQQMYSHTAEIAPFRSGKTQVCLISADWLAYWPRAMLQAVGKGKEGRFGQHADGKAYLLVLDWGQV